MRVGIIHDDPCPSEFFLTLFACWPQVTTLGRSLTFIKRAISNGRGRSVNDVVFGFWIVTLLVAVFLPAIGPLAIHLAKQWPEPDVCGIRGKFGSDSALKMQFNLFPGLILFVVLSAICLIYNVVIMGYTLDKIQDMKEDGSLWFAIVNIFVAVANLFTVTTCAIAAASLKGEFGIHGGPMDVDEAERHGKVGGLSGNVAISVQTGAKPDFERQSV